MPEISRFYGIVIKMFFKPKEHEPSHIHALYGEYVGLFDISTHKAAFNFTNARISTHKMTEGDLPKKAQDMVEEWLAKHDDELQKMWDTQKINKLPPLE